jgi:mannose/fructose/N-acetylgalactosamine-specific phosphotransferase system component IID
MNQALKAIPTYPVSASVYCDLSCYFLAEVRDMSIKREKGTGGPISADLWDIQNILGDVIAPFVHLVVWFLVLILIEKKCFKWMIISPKKEIQN